MNSFMSVAASVLGKVQAEDDDDAEAEEDWVKNYSGDLVSVRFRAGEVLQGRVKFTGSIDKLGDGWVGVELDTPQMPGVRRPACLHGSVLIPQGDGPPLPKKLFDCKARCGVLVRQKQAHSGAVTRNNGPNPNPTF